MKQRIFTIIDHADPNKKLSVYFDYFINIVIFLSILLVVLETYESLDSAFGKWFILLDGVITILFLIEYTLRVWTADIKYPSLSKLQARKEYIFSLYGIIDFLAILPVFTQLLLGINISVLRVLRLARMLRMTKLKRLNNSLLLIGRVFKRKKDELLIVFTIVLILIFISAIAMYYAENQAQPDVFSNAGDAVWWAVITLTTVGYGDMFPITPLGRWIGLVIALLGIGVIALPTGILSGGLMDELNERRKRRKKTCPHCGKELPTY